jgi:hypothetical protein
MRMLVFLAYCAYTVWLGECIPDTGTYANAHADELKDRCVIVFAQRLWPSKAVLNCGGWRHRRLRENVCGSHFYTWGSRGRRFKSCQPDHRTQL